MVGLCFAGVHAACQHYGLLLDVVEAEGEQPLPKALECFVDLAELRAVRLVELGHL